MKFNSNKERRAYWRQMNEEQTKEEIDAALATLKEDTARVITMHYREGFTLPEIINIMEKSGTIIRNHHNRGIFQLHRHFKGQE